MEYAKTNWEDAPSTATPLNAANLNHIEEGIFNNSNDITDINKSLLNCERVYALGTVTSVNSLITYKERGTIYTGTIAYQADYSGDFLMFIINSVRYLLTSDGHLWRFNRLETTTPTKLTYTAAEVERKYNKLETELAKILDLITSGVENVQVSPDYSSQEQAANSYTVETQLLDKQEVDI